MGISDKVLKLMEDGKERSAEAVSEALTGVSVNQAGGSLRYQFRKGVLSKGSYGPDGRRYYDHMARQAKAKAAAAYVQTEEAVEEAKAQVKRTQAIVDLTRKNLEQGERIQALTDGLGHLAFRCVCLHVSLYRATGGDPALVLEEVGVVTDAVQMALANGNK